VKKMKAIGYACINTLSQKPKNLGLDVQEALIREYADNTGLEVTEVVKETTESNNTVNQPLLRELLERSGDDGFQVLIVARLDRLTRNIRQLNQIIQVLCKKGKVQLISLEEKLDTRSEIGSMALNIIDIVTKWDNKRISDRTREIIAKKRAKGERVGHAPFGYTYKNKKLVAVEAELKTIKLIRELRDKSLSYHKIAKHLNDKKVTSKRGGIWYAETVKTVYQSSLATKKPTEVLRRMQAGD